eukprot:357059_1
MDQISKEEYNKIAAPKPSTARNHVLQLAHHIKYGHNKYLQDNDIQKAYITDKGSLKCRGNELLLYVLIVHWLSLRLYTRYWPMAQAKLSVPHNALKCLSLPSY